jgi:hypothetical protein
MVNGLTAHSHAIAQAEQWAFPRGFFEVLLFGQIAFVEDHERLQTLAKTVVSIPPQPGIPKIPQ